MRAASPRPVRGFTLIEVLVAMSILGVVGLMVFLVLNSGMVLYAKNTAVNTAHQQARAGVDQMLQNIHSSVSIPQLWALHSWSLSWWSRPHGDYVTRYSWRSLPR